MDGIRESQKPESTLPMSTPSMERLAESHSKIVSLLSVIEIYPLMLCNCLETSDDL